MFSLVNKLYLVPLLIVSACGAGNPSLFLQHVDERDVMQDQVQLLGNATALPTTGTAQYNGYATIDYKMEDGSTMYSVGLMRLGVNFSTGVGGEPLVWGEMFKFATKDTALPGDLIIAPVTVVDGYRFPTTFAGALEIGDTGEFILFTDAELFGLFRGPDGKMVSGVIGAGQTADFPGAFDPEISGGIVGSR
jgi:hypothetical protein